jgi:phosphatidate cytidylyltransferase
MSDFAVRAISAIALIALSLFATIVGTYYFAVMVAAAATAIFYEWSRLVRGWGLGWRISGFFYALLPALALLWVRDRAEDGLALVLWIFITTWATDIGAYLVGRTMGRTPLAPSISPNKTVEGLIGGVVAAAIFAGAWTLTIGLSHILLVLAPLFAVAAQGGDLFESWMKRRAGVKDSGDMLPGHGGFFDRLDGLIPVALLTAGMQIGGLL